MRKFVFFLFAIIPIRFIQAQSCTDLFISEYIEGSSFNKFIEVYNPTSGTVDLSNYRLSVFFNGSDSAQSVLTLSGSLAPNEVWIACHSSADSVTKLLADTSNSFVINWNGNDAIALVNTATSDTLDVIGLIGVDPGSNWEVGDGSTQDHTLVRNPDVQNGSTDWEVNAQQWTVYEQNDFSHLGSHSMEACPATSPSVFFSSGTVSVLESAGTFSVAVGIINPNGNATPVDVIITGGSATADEDFFLASSQTVSFPANSSVPIILEGTVVNDGFSEPDESIELSLTNAGNGATITAASIKIQITDDDGVGVEESSVSAKVTPTLSDGQFEIAVKEITFLKLADLSGKIVWEEKVSPGVSSFNLSRQPI
jgi:hypothetical protein